MAIGCLKTRTHIVTEYKGRAGKSFIRNLKELNKAKDEGGKKKNEITTHE